MTSFFSEEWGVTKELFFVRGVENKLKHTNVMVRQGLDEVKIGEDGEFEFTKNFIDFFAKFVKDGPILLIPLGRVRNQARMYIKGS